jgi:hypothetical protein
MGRPQQSKKNERSFLIVAMKLLRFAVLAAALAAGAAHAETTIQGVRLADTMELAGTRLVLNGAGVRYRAVFKVYTAALYLPRKASTPEDALAANGPKRIAITMLRDIDSAELGKLFTRSVEDNMDKAAFSRLVPGLLRMGQLFTDFKELKSGDTFTIDWVPGTGTVISVKGVAQGEPFREPEFFNALLRIWLGPNPADRQLKEALLAKT